MKGFSVYIDSKLLGYYKDMNQVRKALVGYGSYHEFDIYPIV